MKRFLLTLGVIALVAIVGGFSYAYMQNVRSADEQNAAAAKETTNPDTPSIAKSAPVAVPGVYAAYEESLVTNANGPVLLFFHAPWCPQCRAIDQDINTQGLPDGVTVLKIDYDSNNELRKRYGVTLQTTFIKVDTAGNQIAKYVAYNEPTFDSVKANLLD